MVPFHARRLPPAPPDGLGEHPLEVVRHALHCVQQALTHVARVLSQAEDGRAAVAAEGGRAALAAGEGRATGEDGRERRLTGQEKRVLTLIAAGASNRGIAEGLGISEKTAKNYVHAVLLKLDAGSRTEAAVTALHERLVDPDECRRAARRRPSPPASGRRARPMS
ncbi:response regulator transcription factor [Saccharothrix sp. Mg75]|uniref:response regulator transcription factor n=1 Tax=Saccharothrix sp. Mg75 TaxID=3445357 RepID=UPI003EEB0CFA